MRDILAEILAHKRTEVEEARRARPIEALRSAAGYGLPRRNFFGAVAAPRRGRPNLIAEVKRASPSAGRIAAEFDPVAIARRYEAAGADAVSVLTDRRFFGGAPEFIGAIRDAIGLPILRKDFLIDEYQVVESRALGADAVLLIAEALEGALLRRLALLARELELCVLLEVHSESALAGVKEALYGADVNGGLLLGINNRDLRTQTVTMETTARIAPLVPPGWPIVGESGVKERRDVERLFAAGARALLVGETLMRSGDVGETVRRLFGG